MLVQLDNIFFSVLLLRYSHRDTGPVFNAIYFYIFLNIKCRRCELFKNFISNFLKPSSLCYTFPSEENYRFFSEKHRQIKWKKENLLLNKFYYLFV